jgi:D-alanyl-lipoteichoic acid acyltransferase DltB (MBOAT superfamily)
MLFNSIDFLLFFPLVTLLYFLLPGKARLPLLFIASCLFYMDWLPAYILILFFIIGLDYCAAIQIERSQGSRRKAFLGVSIAGNVGLLALFKYYNFFNENLRELFAAAHLPYNAPVLSLILPIGLSFHTFQALAYTIEVFKGKQPAERNLLVYALYVMFYPQLVAGPIERPQHLLPQLHAAHKFDQDRFFSGLRLMLWGFFKKVVVADRLAVIVNQVYNHPHDYVGVPLLFATYCFAYQIYCDFSGYSDIAIGAARCMGINLVKNFDTPYCAANIREFWHRWHISLSTWFRDYLYIPLGGSRSGMMRTCLNLLLVFAISGLWHGANWTYVIWGLIHGLCMVAFILWERSAAHDLVASKVPDRLRLCLGFLLTFNLVCLAWIFFRANSVGDGWYVLSHCFSLAQSDQIPYLGLNRAELLIAALSVSVLEIVQFFNRRMPLGNVICRWPLSVRWSTYYATIFAVLIFGEFQSQQFIYFQF